MVGAPVRPGLVMPRRIAVAERRDAQLLVIGAGKARPPIGVLHRVDDDDAVRQDGIDQRIPLGRQQVIGHRQPGIGAADLVPVHAIGEPGDRQRPGGGRPAIADALHIGLDVVDPRHVGARGDDGVDERAALPALRIFHQPHPIRRGGGQRLHVADRHVGTGNLLARTVARHLLQRRDRRVIAAVQKALRRCGRNPCQHHGENRSRQRGRRVERGTGTAKQ